MRIFSGLALPYSILLSFYANFTKVNVPLSEAMVTRYADWMQRRFGLDYKDSKSDNYWLSTVWLMHHSKACWRKTDRWRHECNFARNLAVSFYLAFLYSIVSYGSQRQVLQLRWDRVVFIVPLVYFTLGVLMAGRYYYLYVSYFSRFLFRSVVYTHLELARREAAGRSPESEELPPDEPDRQPDRQVHHGGGQADAPPVLEADVAFGVDDRRGGRAVVG
jgi:hypothetical protein